MYIVAGMFVVKKKKIHIRNLVSQKSFVSFHFCNYRHVEISKILEVHVLIENIKFWKTPYGYYQIQKQISLRTGKM